MTNHDRYKQAFSTLHVSSDFHVEVTKMKQRKALRLNRIAALAAALALVIGCMTAAYAADFGGIQEQIRIWMNGQEIDATLTKISDTEYQVTYPDGDTSFEMYMGGVAIDDAGNVSALGKEDLVDAMNMGEVYEDEDGRVLLSFYDQQVDITDRFDKDGICHIHLEHDGVTTYFTIESNGGGGYSLASSPDGYEELDDETGAEGDTSTEPSEAAENKG